MVAKTCYSFFQTQGARLFYRNETIGDEQRPIHWYQRLTAFFALIIASIPVALVGGLAFLLGRCRSISPASSPITQQTHDTALRTLDSKNAVEKKEYSSLNYYRLVEPGKESSEKEKKDPSTTNQALAKKSAIATKSSDEDDIHPTYDSNTFWKKYEEAELKKVQAKQKEADDFYESLSASSENKNDGIDQQKISQAIEKRWLCGFKMYENTSREYVVHVENIAAKDEVEKFLDNENSALWRCLKQLNFDHFTKDCQTELSKIFFRWFSQKGAKSFAQFDAAKKQFFEKVLHSYFSYELRWEDDLTKNIRSIVLPLLTTHDEPQFNALMLGIVYSKKIKALDAISREELSKLKLDSNAKSSLKTVIDQTAEKLGKGDYYRPKNTEEIFGLLEVMDFYGSSKTHLVALKFFDEFFTRYRTEELKISLRELIRKVDPYIRPLPDHAQKSLFSRFFNSSYIPQDAIIAFFKEISQGDQEEIKKDIERISSSELSSLLLNDLMSTFLSQKNDKAKLAMKELFTRFLTIVSVSQVKGMLATLHTQVEESQKANEDSSWAKQLFFEVVSILQKNKAMAAYTAQHVVTDKEQREKVIKEYGLLPFANDLIAINLSRDGAFDHFDTDQIQQILNAWVKEAEDKTKSEGQGKISWNAGHDKLYRLFRRHNSAMRLISAYPKGSALAFPAAKLSLYDHSRPTTDEQTGSEIIVPVVTSLKSIGEMVDKANLEHRERIWKQLVNPKSFFSKLDLVDPQVDSFYAKNVHALEAAILLKYKCLTKEQIGTLVGYGTFTSKDVAEVVSYMEIQDKKAAIESLVADQKQMDQNSSEWKSFEEKLKILRG